MSQNPDLILSRLEELRKWQQAQQQILIEKQLSQRELLNLEKQRLYEQFGLTVNSSINSEDTTADNLTDFLENIRSEEPEIINSPTRELEDNPDKTTDPDSEPIENKEEEGSNLRNFTLEQLEELKNRLGLQKIEKNESEVQSDGKKGPMEKKPYLKRGQGLSQRFKIHPDSFRLENLPKYKFQKQTKGKSTVIKINKKSEVIPEEQTECLSIPKVPSDLKLNVSKKSTSNDRIHDSVPVPVSTSEVLGILRQTTPPSVDPKPPVSRSLKWAPVLESSETITPPPTMYETMDTPIRTKINRQLSEINELQVFETLENKMNDSSFSSTGSVVRNLLNLVQRSDERDGDRNRQQVRFSDNVLVRNCSDDTESVDTVESSVHINELDDNQTSTPIDKREYERFHAKLLEMILRKSNSVERNDESDSDGTESDLGDETIQNELKAMREKAIDEDDVIIAYRKQLEENIKRIEEADILLAQSVRKHELERLEFEQLRHDTFERVHDERIKMEVQLHDERMEWEQERLRMDEKIRAMRGPCKRDREDLEKLRSENEQLKREAKSYVATQARLRAQIRNLEKDLRDATNEMENQRKENKKLEFEVVRLRRQGNNKILQEINKTIAKQLGTKNEISEPKQNGTVPKTGNQQPSKLPVGKNGPKTIQPAIKRKVLPPKKSDTDSCSVKSSTESSPRTDTDSMDKTTPTQSEHIILLDDDDDSDVPTRREIINEDGSREIVYPNGNVKKISSDGMLTRLLFHNKDIREHNIRDGIIRIYYSATDTWHSVYLDGLEILEFPDGQREHRHLDGTVEVYFTNGLIRITNDKNPDFLEKWSYPDGKEVVQKPNGDRIITWPNGDMQLHTSEYKRRTFPDGTEKTVYADGSTETRYSNGRIRLRDKDGNLVMNVNSVDQPDNGSDQRIEGIRRQPEK